MSVWRLATKSLHAFDPERAHRLTIRALKSGLGRRAPADLYPALKTEIAGLAFPNPLGLAAGFDKNAIALRPLSRAGFGFVEVGAVTPRPQPGNPQPRVFRLARDKAVINRYGFNNDGLDAIEARLARRKAWPGGIVGVNLGANKDSEDRAADYVTCASRLHPHADFLTVNVSSPNTPGLRALQGAASLSGLLASVRKAAAGTRIFLKVAPDLTDEDKADIVDAATGAGIDALIVSNTTVGRERLVHDPGEAGGLSGAPLYALSTEVLRDFAQALGGRLPLIGVGGIFGPDDAYGKILAGASLVQLYTGLVYHGPELVTDILSGLSERLAADGFANVADAVGADRQAGSGGGTSVSTGGSAT